MKLIAYIRGGLGDVWPAVSALKKICEENNINKFNRLVITDSVYYFRDYPKEMEQYSLDMIRKLTPNIIEVPPWINNNFWLEKDGKIFDDTTNELSQEEADKNDNEFMFWRSEKLKQFVKNYYWQERDLDTIFIDCLFTECIKVWNDKVEYYERVGSERAVFEFTPTKFEKDIIDMFFNLYPKHILIPVRKKKEGDAHTTTDDYYQKIITWCNENKITPMLIGVEDDKYEGIFSDMRGSDIFTFEGMGYLIDKCKVMLGNDSGFSAIKLYQQQKDTLLIMNYPRWERSPWYFRAIKDKSNCLLLDAREDNFEKITKSIGDYYATNN